MSQLRGGRPATEVAALVAGLRIMISSSIGIIGLAQLAASNVIFDGLGGGTTTKPCRHVGAFAVGVGAALGLARGRVGARCSIVALPGFRIFQGRGVLDAEPSQ